MKILKSKLQIPALSEGWIERDRLTEEFLRSDETRLIVLQAPAGFGKTTLTRQFLDTQNHNSVAWLHLENLDSEPRRFTAYIVIALSKIYPSLIKSGLVNGIDDNSKSLSDIHEDLLFMIEEAGETTGWLVLDNWEDVDHSVPIRELIQRIISLKKANLKLLIASRKPVSLKTGKLRIEGKAILITEKDLAFNLYECEAVIYKHTGKTVDSEILENLWQATLGWCVSVNLYLQSIETGTALPSLHSASSNNENTLDTYIDEEVLGRIDTGLADFVIRCSVLDSITIESARVVCKNGCDIKENMKALSASSLPHTLLNDGLEIRLHPLFRQASNKILRQNYSHEEVVDIYKRASDYFITQDRIIDAVESRAKTGESKETLTLIDTYWYELLAANGITKIDDWLKTTTPDIRTDPLYIDLFSRALIQNGQNQLAIAYLSENLDPERFKYELSRLISLKTRYHWARINTEQDPAYDTTLQELTSLIHSGDEIDNNTLAGVEVVLCATAYMELKIDASIGHATKALELIGDTLPEYRYSVQDNLAILEHTCGNSEKAIALFKEGIDYCEANYSYSGVPLRSYNMAWIYASTGKYTTALELIWHGRETAERYGFKDVYSQMYADHYEGVIRWYTGEHQKGYRLLKRALTLAKEHNPKEHLEIAIALDHCLLMSGKDIPEIDKNIVPQKGAKRESRLGFIAIQAYVSTKTNDSKSIKEYALEMHEIASTCGLLPWQIHACFLLALSYNLQGDTQKCQDQISAGLTIMKKIKWQSYPMPNELLSAFVFVNAVRYNIQPRVAQQLLETECRIDATPTFTRELQKDLTPPEYKRLIKTAHDLRIHGLSTIIRELSNSQGTKIKSVANSYLSSMKSAQPYPLYITTLGSFEIVQNGKPVKIARKTSLRLFQWLLTIYPKPLHKEIIIEYLWPEASPEKGNASLRTTVKDLRKALDPLNDFHPNTYLAVEDNHYSLLLPGNSVVDSITFLEAISQAEHLSRQQTSQENQQLENTLRKALTLYEGEYLPKQVYEEFAVEQREALSSKYLRASLLLARYVIECDRIEEAITILKDALKVDPLWGDGVYLLIQTLSDIGHAVESMRTFRNYEQRLATELQVEPDIHMVDLFRQLSS